MSEYQFLNNRNGDNGSDDNDNVCGGETHDGNDNVQNIYLEAGNFDRKDNQFGIKEVVENCACESDKKKPHLIHFIHLQILTKIQVFF